MASIVKRDGRLVHVRMDDGAVRVMPDFLAPPEVSEEPEEPEEQRSPVDEILKSASETIKRRPARLTIPSPSELTAIGLFRFAAISRVRKARAQRKAKERLDARS